MFLRDQVVPGEGQDTPGEYSCSQSSENVDPQTEGTVRCPPPTRLPRQEDSTWPTYWLLGAQLRVYGVLSACSIAPELLNNSRQIKISCPTFERSTPD